MYFIRITAPILGERSTVEAVTKSKYLGRFQAWSKNQDWIDTPFDVYYNPKPDESKKHKSYFGFYSAVGTTYVYDATKSVEGTFDCLYNSVTGEVIFSRGRHDYVKFDLDNLSFIDGGRGIGARFSVYGDIVKQGKLRIVKEYYILTDEEGIDHVVEPRHLPRRLVKDDF